MDIIDAMLAEHVRRLSEADDLERMSLRLMAAGAPGFDLSAHFKKVRFIRACADASHHRKEEGVVCPFARRSITDEAIARLGAQARGYVPRELR